MNSCREISELLHQHCSIVLQLIDQQVLFLQLCMQYISVIIMFTLQLPTHVHNVIELLDYRLNCVQYQPLEACLAPS